MWLPEAGTKWPPPGVSDRWSRANVFAGLRESQWSVISEQARIRGMGVDKGQPYLTVPLAATISRVVANLLFGANPTFTAAAVEDQARLDYIVAANDLPSTLRQAADTASAQGEIFGIVGVDPELSDAPIIEFAPTGRVIPTFRGRHLVGATIVRPYASPDGDPRKVYRLLEARSPGLVQLRLYRGTDRSIGDEVDLSALPATAGLAPVVETGINDSGVVWIPNNLAQSGSSLGVSDYAGLIDLLMAANETLTIGQANLRLTGRKRLIVPDDLRGADGAFNAATDVFFLNKKGSKVKTRRQDEPPDDPLSDIQQLQYSYEGAPLREWSDHIINLALTLAGVSPSSIGRGADGAITGTAMRLRMAHTLMEVAGKGRHWDTGLRRLLLVAQQYDATIFGRAWVDATTAPAVERGDGLPVDERDQAEIAVKATAAGAMSRRELVRTMHPDWDESQIEEEVALIEAETTPHIEGL